MKLDYKDYIVFRCTAYVEKILFHSRKTDLIFLKELL